MTLNLAFNLNTTESQKHSNDFLQAAQDLNNSKFEDAEQKLQEILKKIGDTEDLYKFVVLQQLSKTLYEKGDFPKSLQYSEQVTNALKQIHHEFNEETPEFAPLPQEPVYLFLKSRYTQARIYYKIREYLKSQDICETIIKSIDKEELTEAKTYWKFSVKSSYLLSRHYQICMEFRKAKQILEDGKVTLKKLVQHFRDTSSLTQEQKEEEKLFDLINDPQCFFYRKQMAHYQLKFCFFEDCISSLRKILSDELAFHKMEDKQPQKEGEEEKEQSINRSSSPASMSNIQDYFKENKYVLKPSSIPHLQVGYTYYLLGKALSQQLKVAESIANLQIAENILIKVYGNKEIIQLVKVKNVMRETYLKDSGPRNKANLFISEKIANQINELVTSILDDSVANYILAKSLCWIGEVLLEKKDFENAEPSFHKAQVMIGEKYGDNHPLIVPFNTNLIEVYSSSENEHKKAQTIEICRKNHSIGVKHYGDSSIYMLKFELGLASQLISSAPVPSQGDSAHVHVTKMKDIVLKFHQENQADLQNQFLFLGQLLIAMQLSQVEGGESAQRIITYVFGKQLEYVNFKKDHPFLEQTVFNAAIFYRTQQALQSSLRMWQILKDIQLNMYGEDKEVLIYTYKNIGICYLGFGMTEEAEKAQLKALEILLKLQDIEDTPEEQKKEDREQLATLYFNLYLTAITADQKAKAKEYNLKSMEFNKLVYEGENNLQVCNNYYLQGQLEMKMFDMDNAYQWVKKAVEQFDRIDQSKMGRDELMLIKVRYLFSMANIQFMRKDYKDAQNYANKALQISQNNQNISYETQEEMKKHQKELEGLILKSQAKIENKPALDLKPSTELKVETKSQVVPVTGVFLGMTMTGFLMAQMLQKLQRA